MTPTERIDRPRAIREAVRRLVAAHGFHGASMSAIAREAGVATGTAYVHYPSKEELLFAAYLETKAELGAVVRGAVDPDERPELRFRRIWNAVRDHLQRHPGVAEFLVQFDAGPYAAEGHRRAMEVDDDPLLVEVSRPDLAKLLTDLPPLLLYDLALGPLVRAVAQGTELDDAVADRLATAAWRAITR